MSTITVNNVVLSTVRMSGIAVNGEIVISAADLRYNSQSNVIMLTFDAMVQPSVKSGSFRSYGYSMQQSVPAGKAQTAMVLAAEGPIEDTIVISMSPAPVNQVRWRAMGVALAGPWVRNADRQIVGIGTQLAGEADGYISLPESWQGEQRTYIGFFASAANPPSIRDIDKAHVVVKGQVVDYPDRITTYLWNQENYVVGGDREGPWFYAALQVRWNAPTYVPPPTESDNFWATPAPCEASDVFLINNNTVAPYWDVPEVDVWKEPDTLLLNYTEPNGTRWSLNDLEGWWTLPPPALPDLPRPGFLNGSFPVDGRYEPRTIVLRGTFMPGRGVSVATPRLRLLRALDAVRNGALFVAKEPMGNSVEMDKYDPTLKEWEKGPWPKQAWVWLADQPKVETLDGSGRTEFEVQLKAVDPVKYLSGARGMGRKYIKVNATLDGRDYTQNPDHGERYVPAPGRAYGSLEFDVALPAVNKGTTNIWPRFFIYGPASDSRIVNLTTNQVMAFQGSIGSGEVLVVDCYWRTVVLRDAEDVAIDDMYQEDINGSNRRWMLKLSSPWIYLQPGENEFTFHANGASMPASDPPTTDDIDSTQCWVVYRSGWMGS